MDQQKNLNWVVQAIHTPNPSTMKFVFAADSLEVEQKGSNHMWHFANAADAEVSPLASKIFGFPWTSRVSLADSSISITKQDWVDWDHLAEPLCRLIEEHLKVDGTLVYEKSVESHEDKLTFADPIHQEMHKVLQRDIRPVVALDGGDVQFVSFVDGTLSVAMKGSCAGCPSSQLTLKHGIEARMKELFPQIKTVVNVPSL